MDPLSARLGSRELDISWLSWLPNTARLTGVSRLVGLWHRMPRLTLLGTQWEEVRRGSASTGFLGCHHQELAIPWILAAVMAQFAFFRGRGDVWYVCLQVRFFFFDFDVGDRPMLSGRLGDVGPRYLGLHAKVGLALSLM